MFLQREYLALKFHDIAKSILKESKDRAPDAVVWLQRALTLMDKVNDEAAQDVLKEKVLILHKLPVVFPPAYESGEDMHSSNSRSSLSAVIQANF